VRGNEPRLWTFREGALYLDLVNALFPECFLHERIFILVSFSSPVLHCALVCVRVQTPVKQPSLKSAAATLSATHPLVSPLSLSFSRHFMSHNYYPSVPYTPLQLNQASLAFSERKTFLLSYCFSVLNDLGREPLFPSPFRLPFRLPRRLSFLACALLLMGVGASHLQRK
jgi:hypothetical protein